MDLQTRGFAVGRLAKSSYVLFFLPMCVGPSKIVRETKVGVWIRVFFFVCVWIVVICFSFFSGIKLVGSDSLCILPVPTERAISSPAWWLGNIWWHLSEFFYMSLRVSVQYSGCSQVSSLFTVCCLAVGLLKKVEITWDYGIWTS